LYEHVRPEELEYWWTCLLLPIFVFIIIILEELHTYGFHGEALNAIFNVADVTVTIRTSEDELSNEFHMLQHILCQ
jgi:hypothetical protein